MPNKCIAISITLTASSLALIHLISPSLGIDAITVALLVFGALPWLLPFLKSVELPGGLKIELRDAKAATEKIMSQPIVGIMVAKEDGADTANIMGGVVPLDAIAILQHIAIRDPNLAMVGFRIEIEKRLRQVADNKNIDTSRMPLSRLIKELQVGNILPQQVADGLIELVALGNRAAHGVEVSSDAASWVLDVGPSILNKLEAFVQSTDN